ncbi:MAG: hypothetical protein AB7J13_15355 [Pyrinomonadaceae bacterium]
MGIEHAGTVGGEALFLWAVGYAALASSAAAVEYSAPLLTREAVAPLRSRGGDHLARRVINKDRRLAGVGP